MSASTSRPAISSPQKEPALTAARFSNAASPANAARWTNTSRPSIRSFFANSHCENGEAVSIFAGPYTVSHHKSSPLIAGMFSFFNAGSGANQSNHLFKSGAVHQSVHLRGCKFGSGTYIMAPAIEGPFTLVLGRHTQHHDTSAFPFSYLVEQDGRSALMPGANLTSYGTVRDIGKWPERDRRTVKRDRINFEEDNPYLAGGMIDAVNTLNSLAEAHPDAESYVHNHAPIRSTQLQRGLSSTIRRSSPRSAQCSETANRVVRTARAAGTMWRGNTFPAGR